MTRLASALSLIALLAGAPAAAQAARDFQLPPAATSTPETRVQGPVDTDAPVPVRPRAIETARPATPAPTASATPTIVLPQPAPTQATPAARIPAARATVPAAKVALPTASSLPVSETPQLPTGQAIPLPLPSPSASLAASPAGAPTISSEGPVPWRWLALGVLVFAAGAAVLAWRRRRRERGVPEILAPALPSVPDAPADALAISVEAVRMDRSVLNATVGYRVTLRNRTTHALSGVAVEADLVSASGERPAEQQLASPGLALTPRHRAERMAPGQSLRFEGQVRLPLSEASAVWQGRAALLVPLLRVRATAAEGAPVATTLVIGRAEGQASRPQPFRLDEPPRSYAPLAQRVLDAVPARA